MVFYSRMRHGRQVVSLTCNKGMGSFSYLQQTSVSPKGSLAIAYVHCLINYMLKGPGESKPRHYFLKQ